MKYHMEAFFLGFLLDMTLGDPAFLPHPIRLIGRLIFFLEKKIRGNQESGGVQEIQGSKTEQMQRKELRQGSLLVVLTLLSAVSLTGLLLAAAYRLSPYAGIAAEAVMTYWILAARCLKTESMKVYYRLKAHDRESARAAVSMIVGRDTADLDEKGIIRAAVETVAENTSDGVIAPMLYTALGGPVLGFFYKAVNTMDSMIGYRNETYLYFGRAAAKLDDAVNFIPARISARIMIAVSFFAGNGFDGRRAFRIYRRDSRKHASPNAAQTESVCAGALGIRLAGDAVYFGKRVRKPYIGDAVREAEGEDIRRVNRLMYLTAWSCEALCLLALLAVCLAGGTY